MRVGCGAVWAWGIQVSIGWGVGGWYEWADLV
jgi:hypothetical protein